MELVLAPDGRLETKLERFDFELMHPAPVAMDMIDLMNKHSGLGLSANQVGYPMQIFVMKALINKQHGDPVVVMNPVIKGLSEEIESGVEGCLSHPDLILKVRRPVSVMVEFDTLTSDMKDVIHIEAKYDDIDARIFLHEYDHLYGIQFIDRVSKLKLNMAEKKRQKKGKKVDG